MLTLTSQLAHRSAVRARPVSSVRICGLCVRRRFCGVWVWAVAVPLLYASSSVDRVVLLLNRDKSSLSDSSVEIFVPRSCRSGAYTVQISSVARVSLAFGYAAGRAQGLNS